MPPATESAADLLRMVRLLAHGQHDLHDPDVLPWPELPPEWIADAKSELEALPGRLAALGAERKTRQREKRPFQSRIEEVDRAIAIFFERARRIERLLKVPPRPGN